MNDTKLIKTIGHIFFLVLFIYAAYFYVERMLYSDVSFYIFKILSFEKFNIEAGRRMAFLTQIIPLIFLKFHASLKVIMLSYSISFVVIYYLIFLICLYGFSSVRAAIASTVMLFLGISDCSLYPVTELQLGIMFCILLYGYLEYFFLNEKLLATLGKFVFILFGVIIILMCLFSHPSTLFPVLFIIIFQGIDKKLYNNKLIYALLLVTIVVYGFKFLSIDKNSYEGQQMSPVRNLVAVLWNFSNQNSVHFFLKFVLKGIYILPLLLFLVSGVYYLWKKSYLKLAFIIIATIGFFVLLMVVFSPGDSDVGMEKNLLPLWIFIAIPFIHDVMFEKFRYAKLQPLIYLLVIVAGLTGFHRATVIYGDRITYMKHVLESASKSLNSSKIIIEKKNLNQDKTGSTWSYANETLLLSSINGPQNSKTIYIVNELNEIASFDLQKKDVYLCVPFWLEWNYSAINQRYFQLPPELYRILENPIKEE